MAFALLVSSRQGAARRTGRRGDCGFAPLPVAARWPRPRLRCSRVADLGLAAGRAALRPIRVQHHLRGRGRLLFSLTAVCSAGERPARSAASWPVRYRGRVSLPAFHADGLAPGRSRHQRRWMETGDIALTQLVVSTLVGADVVLVGLIGSGPRPRRVPGVGDVDQRPGLRRRRNGPGHVPVAALPGCASTQCCGPRCVPSPIWPCPRLRCSPPCRSISRSVVLPRRLRTGGRLLPWLAVAGLGYATMTVWPPFCWLCGLPAKPARAGGRGGLLPPVCSSGGGWTGGRAGRWRCLGVLTASPVLAVLIAPLLPRGGAPGAVRGAAAGVLVAVLQFVRVDPLLWPAAVWLAGAVVCAACEAGPGP